MELERRKVKRRSARPKCSSYLPRDIILEILSWVPAKSLASNCKCVCKQWCSLIQDHGFLMKHANRAAWVNVPVSDQAILEDGAIENFATINTRLGLMLQLNNGGRKFRIKNPTTRQILDLPELPEEVSKKIGGIFYNEQLQEFKVACFYKGNWNSGEISGAIISLEKDEEWRSLKLIHPIEHDDYNYVFVYYTGSTLHFLRAKGYGSNLFHKAHSLDLRNESSYVTVLPKGVFSQQAEVWTCYWEENLGIYEMVENSLHVMVLEDVSKGKWGEKFVIHLTGLKEVQDRDKDMRFWGYDHEFLFFFRGKDQGKSCFTFHPKTGSVQHLRNPDKMIGITRSLWSLKGMRPE